MTRAGVWLLRCVGASAIGALALVVGEAAPAIRGDA